jgi:hypothetical protein
MKYIVQIEIDEDTGLEVEGQPEALQEWIGKWQALKPLGMYFSMTRRAVTIVVDVPNEDAMFEALHATWVLTRDYPDVWPVAGADEFPALMQRIGMGG